MKQKIAVIGAGIAGLTLARALHAQAEVTLFEKARGVGGRMSTRYAEPYYFDHGAQYFTARSPEFQAFLQPFLRDGTVAEWQGKVTTMQPGKPEHARLWFEPHYVARPHMNSLCKALSAGLDVRLGTEIAPLDTRMAAGWRLRTKQGEEMGLFDWVISTAPAPQTSALFGAAHPDVIPDAIRLRGCYALMLGLPDPWRRPWIAAKLLEGTLSWISVNSSKPGREAHGTSLVVHADAAWSEQHIDADMDWAQSRLIATLAEEAGIDAAGAAYVSTHRWRYALAETEAPVEPWIDLDLGLAAAGDWCFGGRVEAAWQAATLLAQCWKQA